MPENSNNRINLKLGQKIEIFIGDALIFNEEITEENINKVMDYINNGCMYCIKSV